MYWAARTFASLCAARFAYIFGCRETFCMLVARGSAFRDDERLGKATRLAGALWCEDIAMGPRGKKKEKKRYYDKESEKKARESSAGGDDEVEG